MHHRAVSIEWKGNSQNTRKYLPATDLIKNMQIYKPLQLNKNRGNPVNKLNIWIQISILIANRYKKKRCSNIISHSVQFSSVAQSCPTLCYPMNRSMPGLPVHHQLPEFTQTHIHRVGDAIQPSHPLSSPSPPAPNPSQHQSLFQWVNSSREVAKVLQFQL